MTREMKDSGIEWIGQIPSTWQVLPQKYVMHKVKNLCEHYDGQDIISLSMQGVHVRDLDAGGKMPTTFDGYQFVEPEDMLLCLFDIDVTPRCVGIVHDYGLTSPAYSRFKMHDGYLNRYFDYLLRFIDDEKVFVHLSKNLRSSLTETDFGSIKTVAPPVEEQDLIAGYLDRKCAEIDSVIADTQHTIEEYKKLKQSIITEAVTKGVRGKRTMKDSWIEWIGQIPSEWEARPIKNSFFIVSGATPKSDNADYWDGDISWVTPADYKFEDKYVYAGKRNLSQAGYASCGTTLVPAGSIIFSKRAPIGTVAIAGKEICTNQGCLSCVPKEGVCSMFFYYAMAAYTEQFNLYGTGTTFKEISFTSFSDFKMPLPPYEEQKEIASWLEEKCDEIEKLIENKQKLLAELESYKKSVIYEYVTGKKEVPACQ